MTLFHIRFNFLPMQIPSKLQYGTFVLATVPKLALFWFLIDCVSVSRDFVCVPAKQYMHDHIAKFLECTFPRNQIIYSLYNKFTYWKYYQSCPISKFSILFFFYIVFFWSAYYYSLSSTRAFSDISSFNSCIKPMYICEKKSVLQNSYRHIYTFRDIISNKGELGSEW